MPAGVAGNQPNDALTAVRLLTATVATHLLMSTLQRSGITFTGAQEISQGQPVTNDADRATLARLLSELLKASRALL